MNLKQAFSFSAALTCLATNICVASAAQSNTVPDREDSRHLRRSTSGGAEITSESSSLYGVSTANKNSRQLRDTDKMKMMLQESEAIPALNTSRCTDSPLKILIETKGGSFIPFECRSMVLESNDAIAWCSRKGVLASHCPKVCDKCSLYGCSDSKGTFLTEDGCDRDCSWLKSRVKRRKRDECRKPSVAKTCRATCNFCASDDTGSNQPSIESSAVPSGVPSVGPSLALTNAPSVSNQPSGELSAVPSFGPSLALTNAPSVSNQPSNQLSVIPSVSPPPMWSQLYNYLVGETGGDFFATKCAISADGSRLIVGADGHSYPYTGKVEVYKDDGSDWTLVHAPLYGEKQYGFFGRSVGISEDGIRIVVSAPGGTGNFQSEGPGEVTVFEDNGSSWMQIGQKFTAISSDRSDIRMVVCMSADGSRIVIGDPNFHRVDILDYDGSMWKDAGYLSGTDGSNFGWSVDISADGLRLIIGNPYYGQTKVFEEIESSWVQLGQGINGSARFDRAGESVAIAGNGERIVIGSIGHQENSGQVTVLEYMYSSTSWVNVHNTNFNGEAKDTLGMSVGISSDGTKVIMGAPQQHTEPGAGGEVKVYKDDGSAWVQEVGNDLKGEAESDSFGLAVDIAGDGLRIIVGAYGANNFLGKATVFEYPLVE